MCSIGGGVTIHLLCIPNYCWRGMHLLLLSKNEYDFWPVGSAFLVLGGLRAGCMDEMHASDSCES